MTLEGIGIIIDPEYNFFEVARPFAKEFMLKREARHFRNLIVGRLIRGEDGSIAWGKIWKLAKMALKMYFGSPKESQPARIDVSDQTAMEHRTDLH
jgi:predicted unusual protein kinase regulating ubiquinone biosynthesis (AarF/ABC1/UbiB family)